MSIDIREIAGEHAKKYPVGVQAIIAIADILEKNNLLPKRFPHKNETHLSECRNKMGSAILRYNTEFHTPELITETWQSAFDLWVANAAEKGLRLLDIEVPMLEKEQDVLEKPINDVPTMMMFYPAELEGKSGLLSLGKIFPALHITNKENTDIQNVKGDPGWLNVEAALNSPNLNSTEYQLEEYFNNLGRIGMNLNMYILLSQFMKLIRGKFIDTKRGSRLLSTTDEGRVIGACFRDNGALSHDIIYPRNTIDSLGGRSVQLIQKA